MTKSLLFTLEGEKRGQRSAFCCERYKTEEVLYFFLLQTFLKSRRSIKPIEGLIAVFQAQAIHMARQHKETRNNHGRKGVSLDLQGGSRSLSVFLKDGAALGKSIKAAFIILLRGKDNWIW